MTPRIFDHDVATAARRAERRPLDTAERAFWLGMIYAAVPTVGLARAEEAARRIGITDAEREHFLNVVVMDVEEITALVEAGLPEPNR